MIYAAIAYTRVAKFAIVSLQWMPDSDLSDELIIVILRQAGL